LYWFSVVSQERVGQFRQHDLQNSGEIALINAMTSIIIIGQSIGLSPSNDILQMYNCFMDFFRQQSNSYLGLHRLLVSKLCKFTV